MKSTAEPPAFGLNGRLTSGVVVPSLPCVTIVPVPVASRRPPLGKP
jgi:hypothetical protein